MTSLKYSDSGPGRRDAHHSRVRHRRGFPAAHIRVGRTSGPTPRSTASKTASSSTCAGDSREFTKGLFSRENLFVVRDGTHGVLGSAEKCELCLLICSSPPCLPRPVSSSHKVWVIYWMALTVQFSWTKALQCALRQRALQCPSK